MRRPFLRAGKVSIEAILEAGFRKSLIMRTRPRLSDEVTKCEGKCEARLHAKSKDYANAPTTERLCREGPQRPVGAQGPGDLGFARTEVKRRPLVLDGPKRSEDRGQVRSTSVYNIFSVGKCKKSLFIRSKSADEDGLSEKIMIQ